MTAPMARRTSPERVYQLDIRLAYIAPPIWRRILVSDQITLAALHHLLQVVLGWEHSHLHQFLVGSARYGELDPEYDDDMRSDRRVRLRDIAGEKEANFVYEYDFGDSWRHLITVEDLWPRTEHDIVPRCLDGGRASPPENTGAPEGMNICWKCCGTGVMLSTESCVRGQERILTLNFFPCKRSTQQWGSLLRSV